MSLVGIPRIMVRSTTGLILGMQEGLWLITLVLAKVTACVSHGNTVGSTGINIELNMRTETLSMPIPEARLLEEDGHSLMHALGTRNINCTLFIFKNFTDLLFLYHTPPNPNYVKCVKCREIFKMMIFAIKL